MAYKDITALSNAYLAIVANVLQQRWIPLLLLVDFHVFKEAVFSVTPFIAYFTNERLLPAVFQHVFAEKRGVDESFFAYFALVRLLVIGYVGAHVIVQVVLFGETTGAQFAFVWPVFDVGAQVLTERFHVDELLFAHVALVSVSLYFFGSYCR